MRLVFGAAAAKCSQCRAVSAGPKFTRTAHAFELVSGLDGAIIVKPRQEVGRVDVRGFDGPDAALRADVRHTPETGPVLTRLGWIIHGDQIDLRRPGRLRQPGRLMPIVVGLVKQHLEVRARYDYQNAAWIVDDRHPGLEMRINFVRIVLVIQELGGRAACMDHQRIEAACIKRLLRTPHQRLQMRLI